MVPPAAAQSAGASRVHSAGNPYETVELLNALRGDGTLVQSGMGWRWDAKTLRRHIGTGGVLDLLAAGAVRLPEPDGGTLRFHHDRVHQASYGRLKETLLQTPSRERATLRRAR